MELLNVRPFGIFWFNRLHTDNLNACCTSAVSATHITVCKPTNMHYYEMFIHCPNNIRQRIVNVYNNKFGRLGRFQQLSVDQFV